MPSQTPYPTPTLLPTYTNYPTLQAIVVTATFTPSPIGTATDTLTATVSPTQTATSDSTGTAEAEEFARLTRIRSSGFYLVGVDIAPGSWRSTAGHDSCYWARYNKSGDILDNHFGLSGGTIFIRATDFEIEFDGCGNWTYLGP